MGFWKNVALEMSNGISKSEAIKNTVEYYQKYKPNYFKKEEK